MKNKKNVKKQEEINKIDSIIYLTAKKILKEHKKAFEELAK